MVLVWNGEKNCRCKNRVARIKSFIGKSSSGVDSRRLNSDLYSAKQNKCRRYNEVAVDRFPDPWVDFFDTFGSIPGFWIPFMKTEFRISVVRLNLPVIESLYFGWISSFRPDFSDSGLISVCLCKISLKLQRTWLKLKRWKKRLLLWKTRRALRARF